MHRKWRSRQRTATAMAFLVAARVCVAWIPFRLWRKSVGRKAGPGDRRTQEQARQLAADVEWAAKRLPFATKCLERALALSWLMSMRQLGHAVVIAARPRELRASPDALHAWVEVDGHKVLGNLPGPWIETLRSGG